MTGSHLRKFKEPLKPPLPFSFGATHGRLACPKEIAAAGMRSCIQRFDNHVRQDGIDGHSRLLGVQQQFVLLNAVHVELNGIADPQTRIAQQQNEGTQPLGVANTRALAIGFEGSKNADHFFPSKRHCGFSLS